MPRTLVWSVVVLLVLAHGGSAAAATGGLPRANELARNRQYLDAIKVLVGDVEGKPDKDVANQNLLLGECYYLTRQYDKSRSAFSRAQLHLPPGNQKVSAEYRLACVAYRLNDMAGATARIDQFVTDYPKDSHVGKLQGYKMLILSAKGKSAEKDMEALHAQISANIDRYDAITGVEADQILCDFYRKIGTPEKAEALLTKIVYSFRKVIAEREKERQPIPAAIEKAHDNAALQLGILALDKRNAPEAIKWLENVRFDLDSKSRARLLLAKISYERQDYGGAIAHLTHRDFLDTIPSGPIKSDMYLILGLCEKARADGNAGKVEEYLKKVGPDANGFLQAQSALADIYREKGLNERAIECYKNVLNSSDHAPNALFHLSGILIDQAKVSDASRAKALYTEAGKLLERLMERYPLSPLIKQAKDKVELLATKGIDVGFARSSQELVKGWERTAAEKKGSIEGAQALMSLVRHHMKAVLGEKGAFVKAPDYVACAAACDALLDEKVYSGKGFAEQSWQYFRGEVLYNRGLCELASLGNTSKGQPNTPMFLKSPSAAAAATYLGQAKKLIDPKALELVKGIELALLEALFKSDKKEDREQAEKRFGELENDYGNDPRFQRLAMDLGDWYREQNRFAEAAKAYAGVADRGRDLKEEDTLRLLYSAGTLYSRAGLEAQQKPGNTGFCIYIFPKEAVALEDNLLKTYGPLSKEVEVTWPNRGYNAAAKDALVALSKASGIPFVWSAEKPDGNAIAAYLETKKVNLPDAGKYTVEKALAAILDLKRHKLAFDTGVCGGTPTIPPLPDDGDPDTDRPRTIEIFDVSQAMSRFRAMAKPYGGWGGGRSVMLYNVLQRVQATTDMRVIWAEGIDQQVKLATEYRQTPAGISDRSSCAEVLAAALEPAELRFRVQQREAAADLYEAAKDCFNKIRKINPTSKYGERALFAFALNCYNQKDYQRMKLVLREYLKVFDAPSAEFHHEACFWVGWALENERKYRVACTYYARAAEEFLIIYRPGGADKPGGREDLRKRLSYDSQFALSEKVAGVFDNAGLPDLAEFIRINTHVGVKLDPSAANLAAAVTRPAFRGVAAFDVLCDELEKLGLSFKVDNINRKIAERALYRLAWVYRKDNLMDQALENATALLDRYPQSERRRDTQRLMLDIYRGLRDYSRVVELLDNLRASATDDGERRRLELELGWIQFDMANYAESAKVFAGALAQKLAPADEISLRDGYARSLLRLEKWPEAQAEYEKLVKSDAPPLRSYVYNLLLFYTKFKTGKVEEQQFPEDADRLVQQYENMSDNQRERLSPADLAKVTWVYYIHALIDEHKSRDAQAIEKLRAVSNSPDEFIAADATYRIGLLHVKARDLAKARESFEYLLFATRSSESACRATFALGLCLEAMGQKSKAAERYDEVVRRYPLSPLVAKIKANPLYVEWLKQGATTKGSGSQ